MNDKINLAHKLSLFDDQWSPKIIGALNGQLVKLAKIQGEFEWHSHAAEDELFMVVEGSMTLELRDDEGHVDEFFLSPGELYIVPRGVEHRPVSPDGASIMLFEPAATRNTGEHVTEKTVTDLGWI